MDDENETNDSTNTNGDTANARLGDSTNARPTQSDPSPPAPMAEPSPARKPTRHRKRRTRVNWPVILVVGGAIVASLSIIWSGCYVDTGELFDFQSHRYHQSLLNRSFETLLGFCFLVVGLCIGSFLNVVAWRMPRGMSINGFSICPRCRTPISSGDNMPLIGWLRVRGKCRSCRLPISIRYPIIEVAVGLAFLSLYIFETLSQGANLPTVNSLADTFGMLVIRLNPYLLTLSLAHLWGLTFLIGIALIRLNSDQMPLRWAICGLLGWVGICMYNPEIMLIDWQTLTDNPADGVSARLQTMVTLFCGMAAGLAFGRVALPLACPQADGQLLQRDHHTRAAFGMLCSMTLAGAVFGWQAFLLFALVNSLMTLIGQPIANLLTRRTDSQRVSSTDNYRNPTVVENAISGNENDSETNQQHFTLGENSPPTDDVEPESIVDDDEFPDPDEIQSANTPVLPIVDLALWSPLAYLLTLSQWQTMNSKWWLSGPDRPAYVYAAVITAALVVIVLSRMVAGRKLASIK